MHNIIKQLILRHPFYYYILSNTEILYTDNKTLKYGCDTAGVRINESKLNYEMVINEDYFSTLSTDNAVAIIIHELCHIILDHLLYYNKYEKSIYNLATDCEINQSIQELPNGLITLESLGFSKSDAFKGSIYYYNELLKRKKTIDVSTTNYGSTLHKEWNKTVSNEVKDVIENKYENIIYGAASSTNIGNLPKNIIEKINFIKKKRSTIDWKSEFRKFIAKVYSTDIKTTRFKLNRRFGEERPYMKFNEVAFPLISVDTSGSMSNGDIALCFSEINLIHRDNTDFYVIECDADFNLENDVYLYKGKYPEKRGGVYGRGGTSVVPILNYVNKNKNKYSCLIHLTDGYIPKTDIQCKLPMLILLTPNGASVEDTRNLFPDNKYLKILKITN